MAKFNLDLQEPSIDEITLNKHGDKIFLSADDAGIWKKFVSGCKQIMEMVDELSQKIDEIGKQHVDEEDFYAVSKKTDDMAKETEIFSQKAVSVIDGIFGEGTVKKSFRDYYELVPDFVPDADKITAFFETMTPIMEDIFNQKMERQQKESMERMNKYQPRDHKKKGEK